MNEATARFRVLVVEDEPLIGLDIEEAVKALGHEVVGPIDELDEALVLAASAALGCAIIDVSIRGRHPYPVADMLLKRGLPVLLLSDYGKQALPERLREEAHLAKPFTAEQLDKAIRSLSARAVSFRH